VADDRERRIGKNEGLFREANERIERVTESLQLTAERLSILCECGDSSCTERLEVALSDYERVRRDSTLFFVRRGHLKADVEDVVEQTDEYDVVRKKEGPAAEFARKLDPRED
jgi:hypothetical protein